MKILPFSEASRFFNRVREKWNGDTNQDPHGRHRKNQKENESAPSENTPISEEALDQAIASFHEDAHAWAGGLSASRLSQPGPGLKVVLKDGTGAVIRQFTGEEFLKLREAARQDSKSRGKILDQKL